MLWNHTIKLDNAAGHSATGLYTDTPLSFSGERFGDDGEPVPEAIREMLRLYRHGEGSFRQRCKNFYRQGKFMEGYEDDVPWDFDFTRYFATYHDLSIPQLRGYFSWRTRLRKGDYRPVATSLAYMYLYELLCGIGTKDAMDTLCRLREFEIHYIDSGIGAPEMRENLRRWMLEYAVLHRVPAGIAIDYADRALVEEDLALATLKAPREHTDEELFSAILYFAGNPFRKTPVPDKAGEKGIRLFAEVWRHASEHFSSPGDETDIFTACFGKPKIFRWRPLANAVYWDDGEVTEASYRLNSCRSYHCHYGVWKVRRYEKLYFDRSRFRELFHEADRQLRRYFKTGRYLQEKPEEAWARGYVTAVLEAEREAERKASRPRVEIDLSTLERIRIDAGVTRDQLLTEEERWEEPALAPEDESAFAPEEEPVRRGSDSWGSPVEEVQSGSGSGDAPAIEEEQSLGSAPAAEYIEDAGETTAGAIPIAGLDALHVQLLTAILRGEPVDALLKAHHLMPSVVADTINEALFDEIGDNVLFCDGNEIEPVEDYREEAEQLLEEGGL